MFVLPDEPAHQEDYGMSKEDGGAAYPTTERNWSGNSKNSRSEGMTIRDYFAAEAMGFVNGSLSPADFSAQCYRIADAMLAERAK